MTRDEFEAAMRATFYAPDDATLANVYERVERWTEAHRREGDKVDLYSCTLGAIFRALGISTGQPSTFPADVATHEIAALQADRAELRTLQATMAARLIRERAAGAIEAAEAVIRDAGGTP